MVQLPDDCFAFGGALMRLDEALRRLDERLTCVVGDEEAALADCRGRILAEDLVAPEDVPPHDNSAVDGFALRFADLRSGRRDPDARLRQGGSGSSFRRAPARA